MATTPNMAFPYPVLTDSPNVPRDIQALANDVDAKMQYRPVSSTSEVLNPYNGQIVFNMTDGLMYFWKASAAAWWKLNAYAKFAQTTGTRILTAGTIQSLQFPTDIATDPRVSISGGRDAVTLAPGRWTISVMTHFSAQTAGDLYLVTGTAVNDTNTFARTSFPTGLAAALSDTIEFTSTTTVMALALTTVNVNSDAFRNNMTHITFKQNL